MEGTAILAVVSLVLVISGVYKFVTPAPMAALLRTFAARRWPPAAGRGIAVAEICIGALAICLGGRLPAAAVTLCFTLFAGVGILLLRQVGRGARVESCGCFGRRSSRPTRLHVAVNAGCAAAAATAVVHPPPGVAGLVREGVPYLELVVVAVLVALAAFLIVSVQTVLSDTLDAARRQPGPAAR